MISEDDWLQSEDVRRDILYAVSSVIVKKLKTDFIVKATIEDDDKVLEYSLLHLSVGLLYMEFCDAIREGDGMRVLRCCS